MASSFRNLLGGFMPLLSKQAPNVAARFSALEATLANEIVSAEAGAGLVKVTATAGGKLKSVQIDPSLFVPGKQKVVEDLTVAAVNSALEKGTVIQNEQSDKLMRDMMKELMTSEMLKNPFAAFGKK